LGNYDPTDTADDCQGSIGKSLESIFEDAVTPRKKNHMSELSRFTDNFVLHISLASRQLHKDIFNNSPENLNIHTKDTLWASRKNMLENIQYIFDHGNVTDNPKVANIFDDMEKYIQNAKSDIQRLNHVERIRTPPKGRIEFQAFNHKTRKPQPSTRLKGPCG
jgi:hypothetical protein